MFIFNNSTFGFIVSWSGRVGSRKMDQWSPLNIPPIYAADLNPTSAVRTPLGWSGCDHKKASCAQL